MVSMKIVSQTIELDTKADLEFIDLTERVRDFVKKSRVRNGLVNVQTLHTTAPLLLNEAEPLLMEDFKKHLKELSPRDLDYNHNDFKRRTVNMCDGECKNGHSHCLAMHLPSNLTLNISNNELQFGQWQRIFLIELDRPRHRIVQLQILGE
jgi:secondary thiamine-phosphate synthase enzyme